MARARSHLLGELIEREVIPRQLAQLGPLDGQAAHEPVEEALDGERRRALLALIQNLFDGVFGARGAPPAHSMRLLERGGALEPLRACLDELRARRELLPSITAEEREAFLVHLDSRRLLVDRQIAIEQWLAGWLASRRETSGRRR